MQKVYNLISCHNTWHIINTSRRGTSKLTRFMKYETHCDDSGVGMFKMASGVSFVKQFLDSPAEGAKHNDAGCSQRQLYSCARLQHSLRFRLFLT